MIIHAGDTLPKLEDTVLLQGEPVDLDFEVTGLVVTFGMTNANGDEITGAATVVDAAAGTVEYDWQAGDTDTPGVYYGGWAVTHDGGTFTSPGLAVTIYDPAEFWASPQDVENITGTALATNDVVRALQQSQDAIKAYVSRTIVAPAPVRVKRAHALLAARVASAPKDVDGDSSPIMQESIGDYSVRYSRPSYSGSVSDPEMHDDVRKLLSPWRPSQYNSATSEEHGGVAIDRAETGYTGGGGVSSHGDLLGLTSAGAHPASAISISAIAELGAVDDVQEALEILGSQTAQAIQDALTTLLAETNAGASFLSGAGNPDGNDGSNGDYYLNRTTLDLFGPKASSWPAAITNLTAGLTQAVADTLYATVGHNHDSSYAAVGHDHDGDYDALGAAAAAIVSAAAYSDGLASNYAAAVHNHDGSYATSADVTAAIDALVGGAPGTLDTLNELAEALGDDANYSATITAALAGKSAVGHDHDGDYADISHAHSADDITSGVVAVARLGTGTPDGTKFLRDDGVFAVPAGGGGGGVTDHGVLTGLADDDHTQYHTDARGDARYSALGHNHSGTYLEPGDAATELVVGALDGNLAAVTGGTVEAAIQAIDNLALGGGGGGGEPTTGFAIPVCSSDAPQAWKDWADAYGTDLGIDLVCDGTADNVQIQAAIEYARDVVGVEDGGIVVLSPGNFYLADNQSILHHGRVRVIGSGIGNTIVQPTEPDNWTTTSMVGQSATVTWGRPLWDIFFDNSGAAADGPAELAHLTLYGGGDTQAGRLSGLRVYNQSTDGQTHPISGPDIAHFVHDIGIAQVTDVGLWVPGANTGASSGSDTQACHFSDIRVFHTGGHGAIFGGADCYFSGIDVGSTGNRTWGENAYGIWVDGGNHHIWHSKAWYSKRAGVTGASLSGVGWYVYTTRCLLNHCEAQEQANHGFYFRDFRGNATGLMAHSSGTDFAGGRNTQSDAAGFYLHDWVAHAVITGYAFNQGPASAASMKWGLYHEGSVSNSFVQVAWYTETASDCVNVGDDGTAFSASCKYWIGGDGAVSAVTNLTGAGGSGDLLAANNLSDLASAATARTNLGLGTAATTASSAYATAAQGTLADSATQPGDLATVATSGDYDDLSNKPTIPTDYSAAAVYLLEYNGTDDYDVANSGTIPSGAPRMFVGDTDPASAGGGSWTLNADTDQWIDTSA